MEVLIQIKEENGQQLVSGRELHEKLEINTPYKKWMCRMLDYGFGENTDFSTVGQKCPIANGGYQERTDHILTIDMAKEICMIQRTPIGRKFRQYFIECEKQLKGKILEEQQQEIKRLKSRKEGIVQRKQMTDFIKESNEPARMGIMCYATYTDLVYRTIFGRSKKQLAADKGLSKKDNLRDFLTAEELKAVMEVENIISTLVMLNKTYKEIKEFIAINYNKKLV